MKNSMALMIMLLSTLILAAQEQSETKIFDKRTFDAAVSAVKTAALGVGYTVEPLADAGRLASKHACLFFNQSVEAFQEWNNNVMSAYLKLSDNNGNSIIDTMSMPDKIAFASSSILTIAALFYVVYAIRMHIMFKIPLYLLLVPSGIPAFLSVRDLVKQYYPIVKQRIYPH